MDKALTQYTETFTEPAEGELYFLEKELEFKNYKKGNLIIQEGDAVTTIYLVTSGLLKLSYTDRQAKEHILSFAPEGWWETDFPAFYFGKRATFTLQCLEDTDVQILNKGRYTNLITRFPTLSQYFLDKSIKRHIANQKRILSLLNLKPRG